MSTILITGGTGLIGKAITKALVEKGHGVTILTRRPENPDQSHPAVRYANWNIEKQTIDRMAVTGADYIIHLAGANVAEKRWSVKRKKEILESRTRSSDLLVKALKDIPNKVRAVVSASAIGWYGPDPVSSKDRSIPFTETDPHFEDFLGQTCGSWEAAITPVRMLNKRCVILRTGIVLSPEGGALAEFNKPLKFGVATILGTGKQVISWIHLDDLVRMYVTVLENESLDGVYNAVAPEPVTNKELILELASQKRNHFFIPVYIPSFVLKIVLGEMSIEVLKSVTVSSSRIREQGFRFLYPTITAAIRGLTGTGHAGSEAL